MNLPGAIIFANSHLNDILRNKLVSQLQLNEILSLQEFNERVSIDPNYPQIIHNTFQRILILLTNFQDQTNRDLADVVLFLKQGQAYIELNKVGPYGLSLTYDNLQINKLLLYPNYSKPKCKCFHSCSNCSFPNESRFHLDLEDSSYPCNHPFSTHKHK